jgi:hypothetical protein
MGDSYYVYNLKSYVLYRNLGRYRVFRCADNHSNKEGLNHEIKTIKGIKYYKLS